MTEWIDYQKKHPPMKMNFLANVRDERGLDIQVVATREFTTHDGIIKCFSNFMIKPPQDVRMEPFFPEIPENNITHWMPLPEPPSA